MSYNTCVQTHDTHTQHTHTHTHTHTTHPKQCAWHKPFLSLLVFCDPPQLLLPLLVPSLAQNTHTLIQTQGQIKKATLLIHSVPLVNRQIVKQSVHYSIVDAAQLLLDNCRRGRRGRRGEREREERGERRGEEREEERGRGGEGRGEERGRRGEGGGEGEGKGEGEERPAQFRK